MHGMRDSNAIEVKGLSKRYTIGGRSNNTLRGALADAFSKNTSSKTFWALDDLNFSISRGDTVGIVGRNGAGKSTLLKVMSRITKPTKGSIVLEGRVTSLLEVGTGFHPELTGRENIFMNGSLLGMTRSEIKTNLEEIIEFSGVEQFIDTPVKHFSSGMYVRLAFSVAAHLNSEILLVDEVLAVGDRAFQDKCLGKMEEVAKVGKTVLLVSHNEGAIRSLCSKGILLDKGKIKMIGTPRDIYAEYNNNAARPSSRSYNDDSIVRSVEAYYDNCLNLEIEYEFKKDGMLPHPGYVVSNMYGEKLFGGNPTIDGVNMASSYPSKGKVRIRVAQPRLKKGRYRIAVYFGDGKKDLFVDEDCVTLNVEGEKSEIGFILPENEYQFL